MGGIIIFRGKRCVLLFGDDECALIMDRDKEFHLVKQQSGKWIYYDE